MYELSDEDFGCFQRFIYEACGIRLAEGRKGLVSARLAQRLRAHHLSGYGEYLRLLTRGASPQEVQTAIDLLTTNETYFFREPEHYAFLRRIVAADPHRADPWRIWSAASASGEEAYSAAMVLEDMLPGREWEVVGTDVSRRMVEQARLGVYPMERIDLFPAGYLQRFCLKGTGPSAGTLLVARTLRARARFEHGNLTGLLPELGRFDVAFLRNVLIYFDAQTRQRVVTRVLSRLRRGGLLLIGHTESLFETIPGLEFVAPAIYRWRGA